MKSRPQSSIKKLSSTGTGFPSDILPVFFERFPDPLIIWDWESGRMLGANRAAEKVLGYSINELRQMKSVDLLSEGTLDRLPAILQNEQKNNGIMLCTTIRCKAGKFLPMEMHTFLLRFGGNVYRCMVLRPLSENAAWNMEEKAESVAEFLPRIFEEQEMVFEINAEGFITSVNSISLKKTGYTLQDLYQGVHFIQAIIPDERERALRDFERLLHGERLDTLEYTILHKDGVAVPVILSLSPVTEGGEVRGVRGVGLDITEHRRIEQNLVIREKLNMLGELTGGVVHNFNNILSVILGYLEILPTETLDENGRRIIQNIHRAAMDGTDIVHRIQNFSMPGEPTVFEATDLNDIVREVMEFMKPRYESANPHIKTNIRLQSVPPVLITPFEMREVLSNITINAFDAMPEGGVLTIVTEIREGCVALIITDTGIGMTEDTKRRMFEPFFTTKGKKGTGIGMSVSFAIIGKFGGEIKVDSVAGSGTTVTILLPFATGTHANERSSTIPEYSAAPCSILVIDDEENICEILQEFLSRAGHQVLTALGSEQGLALLKERSFDILLTDLNMPGVSGWEIARFVHRTFPKTYIIILTGWGIRIEEINRDEQVVDYLLIKPISFSALTEVIELAAARK